MRNNSQSLLIIIPIFCLLSMACNKKLAEQVQVQVLAETTQSWNGEQLPNYHQGIPKVTILKYTIPPNTTLKTHKHLVINAGVLLKGKLTVEDEYNNILKLEAGDTIVELVNTYHYGKNETNEAVEIIVFYAGNVEVPITVLKNDQSTPSRSH